MSLHDLLGHEVFETSRISDAGITFRLHAFQSKYFLILWYPSDDPYNISHWFQLTIGSLSANPRIQYSSCILYREGFFLI